MISIERGIKDMTEKTFVKILNVATILLMIGGIKKSVGFNHERHIVNLAMDIVEFMNIFAQQVVLING